jgi:hypothetical protein
MDDKTYTIAKIIGEPKQFGDKTRVAFTCNETGETIHSLFTKFKVPSAGETLFGHFESQEKENRTFSNFFFGKSPTRVANDERVKKLEDWKTTHEIRYNRLIAHLEEKGILPRPVVKVPGTNVEVPPSQGATAFDEEFNETDFPDFTQQ